MKSPREERVLRKAGDNPWLDMGTSEDCEKMPQYAFRCRGTDEKKAGKALVHDPRSDLGLYAKPKAEPKASK